MKYIFSDARENTVKIVFTSVTNTNIRTRKTENNLSKTLFGLMEYLLANNTMNLFTKIDI